MASFKRIDTDTPYNSMPLNTACVDAQVEMFIPFQSLIAHRSKPFEDVNQNLLGRLAKHMDQLNTHHEI